MRYWKRVDGEGNTTTVESYSHPLDVEGAVEIDEEEYEAFIASMPKEETPPSRDVLAEIDDLKARLEALESKEAVK